MNWITKSLLAMLACALGNCSAIAKEAEENNGSDRIAVFMDYRVFRGDPGGDEEAKRKPAITGGCLFPVYGYGIAVHGGTGDSRRIPDRGGQFGTTTMFSHGTRIEATFERATESHVRAVLRFDVCSPTDTGSEDFIATRGESLRAAGTFAYRTPYRICLMQEEGGTEVWAEFSFEKCVIKSTLTVGDESKEIIKPPRSWYDFRLPGISLGKFKRAPR